MKLNELAPAKGAKKNKKRIGRGTGSGWGCTAGKGHKGQKSRSGASIPAWFEGGQMPLQRRIPKFGFTNLFKKEFQVVNLDSLERVKGKKPVTVTELADAGLVKKTNVPVKLLGNGEINFAVEVSVHAASKSAVDKITKAGGAVTIL